MGQMRFVIPRPDRVAAGAAEQAYLAGPEGIPWECRTTLLEGALIVERDTRESGYLYFPWIVAGRGLVHALLGQPDGAAQGLSTCRSSWPAERSTACAIRPGPGKPPAWSIPAGLRRSCSTPRPPPSPAPRPARTIRPTRTDHADEAIRLGLEAGDLLVREYSQQVLAIRRDQQATLGTLLGSPAARAAGRRGRGQVPGRVQYGAGRHPLAGPGAAAGQHQWDATDRLVRMVPGKEPAASAWARSLQIDKHALPDWLFLDDGYDEVQASVLASRRSGRQALSRQGAALARRRPHESGRGIRILRGAAAAAGGRGRRSRPRRRSAHAAGRQLRSAVGRIHCQQGPGADAAALCRYARPRRARPGRRRPGNQLRLLARRHVAARSRWRSAGRSIAGRSSACR